VRDEYAPDQQGPGSLPSEHELEHSFSSSSSPSLLYSHLLIDSFCDASYAPHHLHATGCPTYEDIFSIYHPPMQAATMAGCDEGGLSCDQDVI
jgi:hypothetical protein